MPEEFRLGHYFRLTLAELSDRWTLATRGGRIDRTSNGLSLRLKGMRVPEEPFAEAELLLEALDAEDVDRALAVLDGERRREPADFAALLNEVIGAWQETLQRSGITLESILDPALPPIAIRRGRMRAFWGHLFEYAVWALPPEGSIDLILDYDACRREAQCSITLSRRKGELPATHHFAALRRVIADHGGAFSEETPAPGSRIVQIGLPDTIGTALDAWIPRWDTCSPRSQQMLRLLKSGGPTPPEEFILEGVLIEELERWLSPRFGTPAVVNIAHESPALPALKGSDSARRKKALEQIAKSKTKKELCQPQYAGEILWAYAHSERARKAIASDTLSEEGLRRLCELLLSPKPDYVEALRLVAAR